MRCGETRARVSGIEFEECHERGGPRQKNPPGVSGSRPRDSVHRVRAFAWRQDKQAVGPCIDIEVPPGTAVETLSADGKTWVRIVPATGDRFPIRIVNTNLTEQEKQLGWIMARD